MTSTHAPDLSADLSTQCNLNGRSMTAPEANVEFVTRHAALFAGVREHTFGVMQRRRLGGDWEAPENHYRNPWREAAQADAALNVSVAA